MECPVHGQYVIYYNERLPGVTYPDDYSQYAYNELCEVEVFGMYYYFHVCAHDFLKKNMIKQVIVT